MFNPELSLAYKEELFFDLSTLDLDLEKTISLTDKMFEKNLLLIVEEAEKQILSIRESIKNVYKKKKDYYFYDGVVAALEIEEKKHFKRIKEILPCLLREDFNKYEYFYKKYNL